MSKLIVTTASPLAVELLNELEISGANYRIYALDQFPALKVPAGSQVSHSRSYREFLRYLQENPDISEIVFAAKVSATPGFWMQALTDERAPGVILRQPRQISANTLLEFIEKDILALKKSILHPHSISKRFMLLSEEQVDRSGLDITNKLRTTIITTPRERRMMTVEETWLYGVTHENEVECIESERVDTASVIRSLIRVDLRKYSRVILCKRSHDNTQIVYPVIGVTTVQDAIEYGITDIMVTADCVIQGKEDALLLARKNDISIKIIS